MADRPIIFRGPMIRALLSGRKTQTRRVLKPQPITWHNNDGEFGQATGLLYRTGGHPCPVTGEPVYAWRRMCDYPAPYAPGDRLWVREAWNLFQCSQDGEEAWPWPEVPKIDPRPNAYRNQAILDFAATPYNPDGPWRPSIYMPRWASRLTLLVTDVQVQRVREIVDYDAIAEGAFESHRIGDDPMHSTWTMTGEGWRDDTPRQAFKRYWDSLNVKRGFGWDIDPWVVVTSFEVTKTNIDLLSGGEN